MWAGNQEERLVGMILLLPLQILLVLALLTWILGWAPVLAGLIALLCVVPLASFVTWGFSHVRVKVLECTDARVRLISEVGRQLVTGTHACSHPCKHRARSQAKGDLVHCRQPAPYFRCAPAKSDA